MIDYTMTQLVVALGGLGIASLLVLYVLGYLAKFGWGWIDRGESEIKHIFDAVFKPHMLVVSDGQYVTGKGEGSGLPSSWSKDQAMLFFSRKSAEKVKGLANNPDNIKVREIECAGILLAILLGLTLLLTGTVALVVNFPTIMMFILGTVGTVLSARYLRDLQKAAIKIKNALVAHMADTKAHTSEATEIDTEIKIGLGE